VIDTFSDPNSQYTPKEVTVYILINYWGSGPGRRGTGRNSPAGARGTARPLVEIKGHPLALV